MGAKLLFLAFLTCLLVPVCMGEPSGNLILSPAGPYNLGDEIEAILYISTTQGTTTIDVDLVSETNKIDIGNKVVSEAGYQHLRFPYSISKSTLIGPYKVLAKVETSNSTMLFETPIFEISDKLLANFVFNQDKFMVGETLTISGDILKQNYAPVPSGEIKIFGKPAFFIDGEYFLEQSVRRTTPKSINISIKDNYGNYAYVSKEIDIASKPFLNATINKNEFLPGGEILIAGSIINIRGEGIKYDAEVLFNGQAYPLSGTNSLGFSVILPENIYAKIYPINVKVWDEYSNYASENFSITVIPVLSDLSLNIQKENFMPEEAITLAISGQDQATSPYAGGQGTLYIIDNKGTPALSEEILLNELGEYNGSLSAPMLAGDWLMRIEMEGLSQEKTISVKEIGKINLVDVNTKSGIVTGSIVNQKNKNYDTVILVVKDKDGLIIKELPLQLASGDTIDLSELNIEVPKGTYIELVSGDAVLVSSAGWLTGLATGKVSPSVSIIAITILIVVGAIVFIVIKRRSKSSDMISSPSNFSIKLKEIKNKFKENYLKKFRKKV